MAVNFKVKKLGFYKDGNGNIIKVIHIDSKKIEIDFFSKSGPIIGVDILDRQLIFYDELGNNSEHPKMANTKLMEYLGSTPLLSVDSMGYYKNKAGNTVRVIHICDRDSSPHPVFVIDEGTSKFYTTTLYGKAESTEDLDLVEFVSK